MSGGDKLPKKSRFLGKNGPFSVVSEIGRNPRWSWDSMPGQESIRFAKKGCGSSLLNAGFRRFQQNHPFLPASLCGKEEGEFREGLIPAFFGFGA